MGKRKSPGDSRDPRRRHRRRRDEDRRRGRRRRRRAAFSSGPRCRRGQSGAARRFSPTARSSRHALGAGKLPVGLGLCELVDLDGRPASADTIEWRGLDLAAAIEAPRVVLESDVRAAALAEAAFGAGAGRSPFLFAIVGTGASVCLVVDGRPYARRARPGDHPRRAAGRRGRERTRAGPGGRGRAGRGRARRPGARGARRCCRRRARAGARGARERARSRADRARRRARHRALVQGAGGGRPAGRCSTYPSSPPLVRGRVRARRRRGHRRCRHVRRRRTDRVSRRAGGDAACGSDLTELPETLAATLDAHDRLLRGRRDARRARRAADRRERERRRLLRLHGSLARLAGGARRPRGARRAERAARARRLRLAPRRRAPRRLLVGRVPRPDRGDRRRRTRAVRGRDLDPGLHDRVARRRAGARLGCAPAGRHPHAGVLRQRRGRARVSGPKLTSDPALASALARLPGDRSTRLCEQARTWADEVGCARRRRLRSRSAAGPPGRPRSRRRCC